MLNGLYGLIFGNEETAGSATAEKIIADGNNIVVATNDRLVQVANIAQDNKTNKVDNDWVLVEDHASGRSSPVFVASPDIEELDTISTVSTVSTNDKLTFSMPSSPTQVRHSEAARHAKMLVAQRSRLEQKLFEDPTHSKSIHKCDDLRVKSVTNNLTASKLKRSTAAGHVASESKTQPRKKKSSKLSAGRSNDRKVNNLN